MAQAAEAPAGTMAEGQTSHTQNKAPALSAFQLRMLHGGINPNRVRTLNKLAHLEAWDVRRQLIRIFGFGGYSIETLSLDLVHNHSQENFQKKNKQGEAYGPVYTAWTIVYRAQVRLTVFDTRGREISHWEDGAAGDAINQPSVGDAHDMAMKTAFSQALKRCAVNLGDQFGLSLYNDGSRDAVVQFSAAHPPAEWKQQPAPQPEPDDPPVKPEQGTEADEEPGPVSEPALEPAASAPKEAPPASSSDDVDHLARLQGQATALWNHRGNTLALGQIILDAEKHGVADSEITLKDGRVVTFRELLNNRIIELQKQAEQNAA
ncbi:Rad52/Rad22 family DNA repair protein [Streptomyces sp. NPDC093269]|uniref:Rad52/Rad22 family DNA repair protein n=1 Tax=Streptomyces sp. NPDC093269 TaxID=3366038 RepID=UPI00380983C9